MNALASLLALIHLTLVRQHPTLPRTVDIIEGRDGQVWAWSTPLKGGWLLPFAGAPVCREACCNGHAIAPEDPREYGSDRA